MEALVEIKTNKKIENLEMVLSGTEKYNSIVNDILKCRDFELIAVQPFLGHPEQEKEFESMESAEATFITIKTELNPIQIEKNAANENTIIDKAMEALGTRALDILSVTKFGNEAHVYFNKE